MTWFNSVLGPAYPAVRYYSTELAPDMEEEEEEEEEEEKEEGLSKLCRSEINSIM